MCWKTFEKKNVKVKTAKRDISVFKVVNIAGEEEPRKTESIDRAYPYYRYDKNPSSECTADRFYLGGSEPDAGEKTYAYEPGKEYSASGFARSCTVIPGPPFDLYCRTAGFHSYSPQCILTEINACYEYVVMYGRAVNDRYPSYKYTAWTGLCVPGVMDCVIPKGARYCVNEQGEYVSDMLRVKGFRTVDEVARK